MRIWHVPFGELDDQRILGQHQEIHALWSLIHDRGYAWDKRWSDPNCRVALCHVHELAVAEMSKRGFKHHTPIPFPSPHVERYPTQEPYWSGTWTEVHREKDDAVTTDRWHLVLRWGGIYRGRVPLAQLGTEVRQTYERLMFTYGAQGGCLHDGEVEREEGKRRGWETCLLCKRSSRWHRGGEHGPWIPRKDILGA